MSDIYCEISYYVLFQKQAEIKTQKPVLKNDVFTESRIPTRNEMLLKMSEEKRLEKLQKERAKLLEATLMRPEEMVKSAPIAMEKIKILRAVLDLPAKQHCRFGQFGPILS